VSLTQSVFAHNVLPILAVPLMFSEPKFWPSMSTLALPCIGKLNMSEFEITGESNVKTSDNVPIKGV
jgi:hypothetical protein